MKKHTYLVSVALVVTVMFLISIVGEHSFKANKDIETIKVEPKIELMVGSAGSLKDSLLEIKQNYEKENKNVSLVFDFASSGTVQKHIQEGAKIDLFISASEKQVNELSKRGFIDDNTRVDILSDELVLITPTENNEIKSFKDLTKDSVKYIGIGEENTVPAAKIAKQTLENLGIFDSVKPKFVTGKDLMQVMYQVEAQNSQAGLVWQSIAKKSDKVKVVDIAPENSHKKVTIVSAVVSKSKNQDMAKDFLEYIQNNESMKIFKSHGFKMTNDVI